MVSTLPFTEKTLNTRICLVKQLISRKYSFSFFLFFSVVLTEQTHLQFYQEGNLFCMQPIEYELRPTKRNWAWGSSTSILSYTLFILASFKRFNEIMNISFHSFSCARILKTPVMHSYKIWARVNPFDNVWFWNGFIQNVLSLRTFHIACTYTPF